jgi:hypothetical protein
MSSAYADVSHLILDPSGTQTPAARCLLPLIACRCQALQRLQAARHEPTEHA